MSTITGAVVISGSGGQSECHDVSWGLWSHTITVLVNTFNRSGVWYPLEKAHVSVRAWHVPSLSPYTGCIIIALPTNTTAAGGPWATHRMLWENVLHREISEHIMDWKELAPYFSQPRPPAWATEMQDAVDVGGKEWKQSHLSQNERNFSQAEKELLADKLEERTRSCILLSVL